MTHTDYRLSIARRNAAIYATQPNVRAIILVGSLPLGRANAYSDIDMLLLYDGRYDDAFLQAACAHNGGERRKLLNEKDDSILEIYYVGGVECQFLHSPVSFYTQQIEKLVMEHSTESLPHLVAEGLMHSLPLHGQEYIAELQARLAAYPDELARKLVQENIRPLPANELRFRIMREHDLIRFHGYMQRTLDLMLKTLHGLNRQYIPGEWKKLDLVVERLPLAPANLLERMNRALCSEQYTALDILDALWHETVELVRSHMPQVDLTDADMRLNYTVEPVELPKE